ARWHLYRGTLWLRRSGPDVGVRPLGQKALERVPEPVGVRPVGLQLGPFLAALGQEQRLQGVDLVVVPPAPRSGPEVQLARPDALYQVLHQAARQRPLPQRELLEQGSLPRRRRRVESRGVVQGLLLLAEFREADPVPRD